MLTMANGGCRDIGEILGNAWSIDKGSGSEDGSEKGTAFLFFEVAPMRGRDIRWPYRVKSIDTSSNSLP